MSSNSSSSASGGIGVFGLLGATFIFCKLAGVTQIATWSWVWVLSPFWIGLAFALAFFIIMALIVAIFR